MQASTGRERGSEPVPLRSVLIIGSGPIVIGQAAEFDYSGTQACLACRDAGVCTILVNSNPATIQTDPQIADAVYIEPLTVETLRRVIDLERPDGLIATVGGQTALNLAVELAEAGVLEEYGVRVLGTGLDAIHRAEDRALFAATLRAAGQPILPSVAVSSQEEAVAAAEQLGYPIMCRSAFALGGAGSGFARDAEELTRQVDAGLRSSGSGQVLIEKSVRGWSEIEYEVVRDGRDNRLIVCNMENVDPMGVHTGDSIVVAPSQTLDDRAYQMLRTAAMDIVRSLDVVGACNVQFAFDRRSGAYYVIEVNPRLSRSSALASKATGYPIAKVATEIALGRTLPEIRNQITGTTAFFEPALDYVTVKVPRWPFDKFTELSPAIGTAMRSTGEVMAIGGTFEEALVKAVRGMEAGADRAAAPEDLPAALAEPNGHRLLRILQALGEGWTPEEIAELTSIHPWFLDRMAAAALSPRPDATSGSAESPTFKMVDTCAGEFEARTPYFYGSSRAGRNEAPNLLGPKAIILGSGPIRIGQGIEFDYVTVHACRALSNAGVRSIIVNNNPETVSTDYSTSDRLYFEPLDESAVWDVVRNERDGLLGVIPQFGGQTAINLVHPLMERGVQILGTPPQWIDAAEDRAKASAVLEAEGIPAPRWASVDRWSDVAAAVRRVGFPALLRPSYVLSGRGMTIVRRWSDVERYVEQNGHTPLTRPLLVDQFLEGAIELNVDVVSDDADVVTVTMEQIEECGVHSGDSWEVYPPQTVSTEVLQTVERYARELARAFRIVGLMNVQLAVHDGVVYVLEVNPRASRSVPFASKASGIPLTELAVGAILGRTLGEMGVGSPRTAQVCIKSVVHPFRVFPDLPPVPGPEMQSTGESMGIGADFSSAYWKAWLGSGRKIAPFGRDVYLSPGADLPGVRARFAAAGCRRVQAPEDAVDVAGLGLAVVLDRSPADIEVLRRAVQLGVPTVTNAGALRGLLRAMEGRPCWEVVRQPREFRPTERAEG